MRRLKSWLNEHIEAMVPEVGAEFCQPLAEAWRTLYAESPRSSVYVIAQAFQHGRGWLWRIAGKNPLTTNNFADQINELRDSGSLPWYLAEDIHWSRNVHNLDEHEGLNPTKGQVEVVLARALEFVQWFCCRCKNGRGLQRIYDSPRFPISLKPFLDDHLEALLPEVRPMFRTPLRQAREALYREREPSPGEAFLCVAREFARRGGWLELVAGDQLGNARRLGDFSDFEQIDVLQRERLLPAEVAVDLRWIAWLRRMIDRRKGTITRGQAEGVLARVLDFVQWFHCDYEHGRRLRSIYRSGFLEEDPERPAEQPPQPIVGRERFRDVAGALQDRDAELERLRRHVGSPGVKLVCIAGQPGSGKTHLLCKLCEELEPRKPQGSETPASRRADGIIYLDCYRRDTLTTQGLFRDFGALLGSPHAEELAGRWFSPLRDKTEWLLEKLGQGSYLLALDNLENALEEGGNAITDPGVREFLHLCLTRKHGLRLVAATRREVVMDPEAQRAVQLVPLTRELPFDAARELLLTLDPDGELGLCAAPPGVIERAVHRCHRVPRALELLAHILRSNPTLRLEILIEDDALFNESVVRNLVEEYHRRLGREQQQVLEAVAVYTKSVPAEAIHRILESFLRQQAVDDCLAVLVRSKLVIPTRSVTLAAYQLHPLDQEYVYDRIPNQGDGYFRKALHGLAADYYADLVDEYEASMKDIHSYLGWYRYEDQKWQELILEQLYHLGRTDERPAARLALARRFFEAFWWWGSYMPFPFCTELLERWAQTHEQTQTAPEDGEWLHSLQRFHEAYHEKRRQDVIDALNTLRRLAGVRDEDPDPVTEDQRKLWTFMRVYLGDAYRWLPGDGTQRAEDGLLAEDYYRRALDTFEGEDEKAWMHHYLSDLLAEQDEYQRAIDECCEALDIFDTADPDDRDYELIGNTHRVLGDVYFKQCQYDNAFQSYNRAVFCAFAFQAFPQPPDTYTRTFYLKMVERARERLGELAAEAERQKQLAIVNEFWPSYWGTEPPESIGVRPDPFPPAPEETDIGKKDGDYVRRVRRFVEEKGPEVELVTL